MPSFVLNRNHVMRTMHGHSIGFQKGVPTHVPPICVKDALHIGAEPVDGKIDMLDPEEIEVIPLSADERAGALRGAFKLLEGRSERSDFTAQGIPAKAALVKIVDFDVAKAEYEPLWVAYVAAKSEE